MEAKVTQQDILHKNPTVTMVTALNSYKPAINHAKRKQFRSWLIRFGLGFALSPSSPLPCFLLLKHYKIPITQKYFKNT